MVSVQAEILRAIVGSVAVDVVNPLGGEQGTTENLGHYLPMLKNSTDPDVTRPGQGRRLIAEIPLRKSVECREAAGVRTVPIRPLPPVWASYERFGADLTYERRWGRWVAVDHPVRALGHVVSLAHSHAKGAV